MRYILFFLMFSSGLFAQGIEPSSLQPTPYQGGILKGVTPYVDPFSGDTHYIYQHDTIVFNPDSIYVKTATAPDPDTIYLRDGSGFALIPKGGGGGSGTLKGAGTPTQVAYFAASDSLASDSDMYFDALNKRLGIGITNPEDRLHISNGDFRITNPSFSNSGLEIRQYPGAIGGFGVYNIRGTNPLIWSTHDDGIQIMNHTKEVRMNSNVQVNGNFGANDAWLGTSGVLLVDDVVRITATSSSANIKAYKYAGSPYPPLDIQATRINFHTSTSSAWPTFSGISAGDIAMSIMPDKSVGIGTTSPARKFHVNGEARITDLVTDTPTRIVGADNDGDLGELKLGNGLTISNDSLIVTVSGGGGDDWGTQVVERDITLLGDGTSGNLLKVDTSIIATHYDLTQININDADADPNNEIQNLSHTVSGTNRTINISGGTGTTISVADNDNSSSNELNTSLTVSHIAGNALPRVRITDAGGTLEGLVPFFSTSNVNAGVVPGSNGASTSNFLRADGIWATPVSSGMTNWNLGINNGSYTAVGDGANVSLNAGTNVTLSKSGNTVTINSPSRQTWADFGSNMQAWFSTGAYGSGKDVGIGVSPTADLDVNGTTRLRGPIFNSANSSGTSGQVLTSQGSGAWTWTTISSTDDQNLSYGTKSGARIPLDIQDGVGVNFDEGRGILLTRTSSNVLTVNGRRDWMHVSSSSFNQTLTANTWAVLNLSDSPSGYNFTWNNTTKRLTKTGFDGNVYLNFNCLARIGSTNTGTLEVGYFLNGSGTPFRVRNYTLANMSEDFEINLQENQYMGINDYIEIKVRASADRTVNFDTPSFNAQPQDH